MFFGHVEQTGKRKNVIRYGFDFLRLHLRHVFARGGVKNKFDLMGAEALLHRINVANIADDSHNAGLDASIHQLSLK